MEIIASLPPNFHEISKHFNFDKFTPIFAYGDKLYNPAGLPVSQDLMIHEEVHQKQQEVLGVEQWWAMYLENPKFRLSQEVEAFRAQYQFLKTVFNRKGRLGALNQLSENLASELYGNIINKKLAKELIDE